MAQPYMLPLTKSIHYTVDGFLKAGLSAHSNGEVISVGTGSGATIGEIVDLVQEIVGTHKNVLEDFGRVRPQKSEVFKLICDNRKAKELLDWGPKVSLKEGLIQTVNFIQNNISSFNSDQYVI